MNVIDVQQKNRINISASAKQQEKASLQKVMLFKKSNIYYLNFVKVICLQQIENEKLQESVNVLECELENSKLLLDDSQKIINGIRDELLDKKETIVKLEEYIKEIKLENDAFEKCSAQNKILLEKYSNEVKENARIKEELQKLLDEAGDLKISVETRHRSFTEREIDFLAEIRHLKEALRVEVHSKSILDDTCKLQKRDINELREKIIWLNEIHSEQIARSRQTEYKTMQRAEELLNKLNSVSDEKEIIQDALQLTTTHASTLKSKLDEHMEYSSKANELLTTFVSKTEDTNSLNRIKDRKVKKEIEVLTDQLLAYKTALLKVSEQKMVLEEKLKKKSKKNHPDPVTSTAISNATHNMDKTGNRNKLSHGQTLPTLQGPPPSRVPSASSRRGLGRELEEEDLQQPSYTEAHTYPSIPCSHTTELNSASHIEGSEDLIMRHNVMESALSGESFAVPSSVIEESSRLVTSFNESVPVTSPLEALQYQGKRCLLVKHLRHLVTLHNTFNLPSTLRSNSLDLSRCALTDDDLVHVIEWLRLMSIKDINMIDFRSNVLTGRGASMMATWLLSLDPVDLTDRAAPLEIDFKHNMVVYDTIISIDFSYLFLFLLCGDCNT